MSTEGLIAQTHDRLFLIEVLAQDAMKSFPTPAEAPKSHERVAFLAGVAEGTVANVMHLTKALTDPKRRVRRKKLIAVLALGLRLPRSRISPILWLFDGTPMTDNEAWIIPDPQRRAEGREPSHREAVLRQLEAVLARRLADNPTRAQAATVIQGDPESRIKADEELLELESTPGQELNVSALPAVFSRPPERWRPRLPGYLGSEQQHQRNLEVVEKRYAAWSASLTTFGMRSIHSSQALLRYVRDEYIDRYPEPVHVRRAHIEYWLHQLERTERYEVGLRYDTPFTDVKMKLAACAIVRPQPAWYSHQDSDWGPYQFVLSDMSNILSLYISFERAWDRLDVGPDRSAVLEWIRRELLGLST